LQGNCEMLEKRIQCMRIGVDKLLVFSVTINEKAETYNMSISAAAYRVIMIDDIENCSRIGGLKRKYPDLLSKYIE